MRKILVIIALMLIMNSGVIYAAPKFSNLTFEELNSLDTSELSEKELKKYEKAIKKEQKRRDKIIAKERKKHNKKEAKRIKGLKKSLEFSVYKNTSVSKSEFDPVPVAEGPREYISGEFYEATIGYGGLSYFLRSIGDKTIQIYVIETYSGEWQHWNKARLPGGDEADFTSISREVLNCEDGTCKFEEHFGIALTKDFFENWYEKGGDIRFQVKGTSSGSEMILSIPESYVYGFLNKINAEFKLINPELVNIKKIKLDHQLETRPFVIDESLFVK